MDTAAIAWTAILLNTLDVSIALLPVPAMYVLVSGLMLPRIISVLAGKLHVLRYQSTGFAAAAQPKIPGFCPLEPG